MIIVQACDALFTGDGRYRMHQPSEALGQLPGITAIDCPILHPSFRQLSESCDILILQFFNTPEFFPLIERRRRNGKATLFETADFYLDIQPWNPIAPYWNNPDLRRLNREFIAQVDAVQTSTARLSEHWKALARKIVTFDNHLQSVPELGPLRTGALTLGWAGSQGHLADWQVAAQAITPWLHEHPDVNLAVMSHFLARDFIQIPAERFYFQEAGILEDYLSFLRRLDIAIAPNLPTEYNRCRSDVKFLEYAAHGIVGIYQDIEPYRATVEHGVNGFLYRTGEELRTILTQLKSDTSLRSAVRSAGYQYVKNNRILAQRISERLEFYRLLLKTEPTHTVEPALIESATRSGNYYQLSLSQEIHQIMNAGEQRSSPDAAQKTLHALMRYPDYLHGLHLQAKLLNDCKMPHEALSVLARAEQLDPEHARTGTERGRAYSLLGEDSRAQESLERAVEVNPLYHPAWSYLMRFSLGRQTNPDLLIQKLDAIHPLSVSLAIQSLELLNPADRVRRLQQLLTRYAAELSGSELHAMAGPLIRAITRTPVNRQCAAEGVTLIEQAKTLLPNSAALHDYLAQLLRLLGNFESASEQECLAAELALSAKHHFDQFGGEPPQEMQYRWLIAQHLGDFGHLTL